MSRPYEQAIYTEECPNCDEPWDLEQAKPQANYFHCLNCGRIMSEDGEIIKEGTMRIDYETLVNQLELSLTQSIKSQHKGDTEYSKGFYTGNTNGIRHCISLVKELREYGEEVKE